MENYVGNSANQNSYENVSFAIAPVGIWGDTNGHIYYSDNGNCLIRKIVGSYITTIAGTNICGYSPDGLITSSMNLGRVCHIYLDTLGNIYYAECGNYLVRKITISTGTVSTVAGQLGSYLPVDNVQATASGLYYPTGVWGATNGNLYIADTYNHRIRQVVLSTGIITTFAGNGGTGYTGDGVAATSTSLYYPQDMHGDTNGNLYIADYENDLIRVVNSAGIISTYVSGLFYPCGVFVSSVGTLYFADTFHFMVKKVVSGSSVVTVAGSGAYGPSSQSGAATSSGLSSPEDIWVDTAGNVYIAETGSGIISYVSTSGIINRIVGDVIYNDGGPAAAGRLHYPTGIWGNTNGVVYVAEYVTGYIRYVSASGIINTLETASNAKYAFGAPYGIYGDTLNNLYVADEYYQVVFKIPSNLGTATIFAGTSEVPGCTVGVAATSGSLTTPLSIWINPITGITYISQIGCSESVVTVSSGGLMNTFLSGLNSPYMIWGDSASHLFITQTGGNTISMVNLDGTGLKTILGSGSIYPSLTNSYPGTSISFASPYTIHGDSRGNLYSTDAYECVRMMIPTGTGSYNVSVIGGTAYTDIGGYQSFGDATSVPISTAQGLWLDSNGNIFITDTMNLVRKIFIVASPSSQPTSWPSRHPSSQPSERPSTQPTVWPTNRPSSQPTSQPVSRPSSHPSKHPSSQPTLRPSSHPSSQPSNRPTKKPSSQPTDRPTRSPSSQPLAEPSSQPTLIPSDRPSSKPTTQPTSQPSNHPSGRPSSQPLSHPSSPPSSRPSSPPSTFPTDIPSSQPTERPSTQPISFPTTKPSSLPSISPTKIPTSLPTFRPTKSPSSQPTAGPSSQPTAFPTNLPSSQPTVLTTSRPTAGPSFRPSSHPSSDPTLKSLAQPSSPPSNRPSISPSSHPSIPPTQSPFSHPTERPSLLVIMNSTRDESSPPTSCTSSNPSSLPTLQPSSYLSSQPSLNPSSQPSSHPTSHPTTRPTILPSPQPTGQLSGCPSSQQSSFPTRSESFESTRPTLYPSNTILPSLKPALQHSIQPLAFPMIQPCSLSSYLPSSQPSYAISNNGSLPENTVLSVIAGGSKFKLVLFPLLDTEQGSDSLQNIDLLTSSIGENYLILGNSAIPTEVLIAPDKTDIDDYFGNTQIPIQLSHGISLDSSLRSAATADLNGDGVDDIIIGDPNAATVYVFFGNATVPVLERWTEISKGFTVFGIASSAFGWSVSSAGDFNGDGIEDMIISALDSKDCYVIFGKRAGNKNIVIESMTAEVGLVIVGSAEDAVFGLSVSGGDMNGDGFSDIAISAMGSLGTGVVHVVYGGRNIAGKGSVNLDGGIVLGLEGLKLVASALSFGGVSVSMVGDVNGDGLGDIAIGSVPYGVDGYTTEISYVIYGKNSSIGNSTVVLSQLSKDMGFMVIGGGIVVTGVGDVNEDGFDDVMVTQYDGWQSSKSSTFGIVYPAIGSITAAPSSMPSSSPSLTSVPSSVPTEKPSHHFSSQSIFPTIYPSGPSITPSFLPTWKTNSPSTKLTPHPSFRNTRKPSILPSAKSSSTPTTHVPVSLPTLSPSALPTSSGPTRVPTCIPTIIFPANQINTTHILNGGSYSYHEEGNVLFVIQPSADVSLTVTGQGKRIFQIASVPTIVITINEFNMEADVIDLSAFPLLYNISDLSYSTNPFTILLPNNEKVTLTNVDTLQQLPSKSFLFGSKQVSSNDQYSIPLSNAWLITIAAFISAIFLYVIIGFSVGITKPMMKWNKTVPMDSVGVDVEKPLIVQTANNLTLPKAEIINKNVLASSPFRCSLIPLSDDDSSSDVTGASINHSSRMSTETSFRSLAFTRKSMQCTSSSSPSSSSSSFSSSSEFSEETFSFRSFLL